MEKNDDKAKVTHRQEEDEEVKQEIWSWGAGTDGQLGTGRPQDELLPQLLGLPSLSSSGPISLLACGGAHVIALTSGGRVVTWGRGTSGQLGHGDTMNSPNPKLVMLLESHFVSNVSAGWNYSGFVSDTGSLFTCGDGSFGQLGHGDYKSHSSPVKVSYFVNSHVQQMACGMRHSLVLLKDHSGDPIYAFGSGKRGQLGISRGKVNSISLPEVTLGLEGAKIVSIAANGDHSAALSANGNFYTWGRGFRGKSDAHYPEHLSTSFCFIKAAFGWNHALLLSGNGEAFMLGGNRHGVLNNPDKMSSAEHLLDSEEAILEEVPGLEGKKVVDIAAGSEHSALVTGMIFVFFYHEGVIKTWGWGEHGQLGLGDTLDQTSPHSVSLGQEVPSEAAEVKVYCGSGFTIVLKTRDAPSHRSGHIEYPPRQVN
ncbi:Regulator of chromosome condensation 1/beta-lactamase-inhibitor protein II [Parasponia andersonii]|uniref:Regulator of chromosome condensation 1/beta-lactamase-inhibitor protein II n=1 Tax=Parasponia andersonii TaxID=3476 RepID=A0A2P5D2G5_PARAD|nr:Regulator of chromosome condensation 1/beta-lactamase-inhibitor protein II [Parasponia andersonii]